MTIAFRCGQCGQLLRVPDQSAGKNARCPKCNALMQVPFPTQQAPYAPVPGGMGSSLNLPGQAMPQQPSGPFPQVGGGQPTPPGFGPAPTPNPYGQPAGYGSGSGIGFPSAPAPHQPAPGPYQQELPTPFSISTRGSASRAKSSSSAGIKTHTGLPWETKRQNIGMWWETSMMILGSPSYAFTKMKQRGGLGQPMMYSLLGLGIPSALVVLMLFAFTFVMALMAGDLMGPALAAGMVGCGIVAAAVAFYVVMGATVGALINAGLYHLMLMLVGGAKQEFETTFRVVSYVQGSLTWIGLIPLLGMPVGPWLVLILAAGVGLVMSVWIVIVFIIGLAKGHDIPVATAAMAVLLPTGICFALSAILSFVIFGGMIVTMLQLSQMGR
jgi:hypothetical protein